MSHSPPTHRLDHLYSLSIQKVLECLQRRLRRDRALCVTGGHLWDERKIYLGGGGRFGRTRHMKPRWLPTGKRSILMILRKSKGLCLEQSNKHLNISFFEKFDIYTSSSNDNGAKNQYFETPLNNTIISKNHLNNLKFTSIFVTVIIFLW